MSEWQPIETAPMDGSRILLAGGFNRWISPNNYEPHVGIGRWNNGKRVQAWYDDGLGRCPMQPFAWQPIPKPPEVKP